ncbi:hypothetical protein DFQ26_003135 [Actinomortierella ambigua]|nr:hypothetical protein DFQ26_003135 [Actinomortierella ambigua]
MPPVEMSFKEKYLKLREKFDAVSGVHRQYANELDAAQDKVKRLKEENDHLLDLLSDMMSKEGAEPMSDSDTSSDNNEEDEVIRPANGDVRKPRHSSVKDERSPSSEQPPAPDRITPVNGR